MDGELSLPEDLVAEIKAAQAREDRGMDAGGVGRNHGSLFTNHGSLFTNH